MFKEVACISRARESIKSQVIDRLTLIWKATAM